MNLLFIIYGKTNKSKYMEGSKKAAEVKSLLPVPGVATGEVTSSLQHLKFLALSLFLRLLFCIIIVWMFVHRSSITSVPYKFAYYRESKDISNQFHSFQLRQAKKNVSSFTRPALINAFGVNRLFIQIIYDFPIGKVNDHG